MTDEGKTIVVDFEAEYKRVLAERDAFAKALNDEVDKNNKLSADLKVQQAINRKTIGASGEPPKTDDPPKKVSLEERIAEYRKNATKES